MFDNTGTERIGRIATWKIAARTTLSLAVDSTQDSGAFTGIYADEAIQKQIAECVEAVEKPIASRDRVIGVIVAINGKPEAVDVFGSTPLFRKLWPKLSAPSSSIVERIESRSPWDILRSGGTNGGRQSMVRRTLGSCFLHSAGVTEARSCSNRSTQASSEITAC